jgi:hypothetical chaperone protein
MHPAIGIDFGTTNSSVALASAGGVRLVTFSDGSAGSRSLLYLEKTTRGLHSSSGALAIERYLRAHEEGLAPGRLVQSLKSYLPVRSLATTEVFGRPYSLEELISRILLDLRERAEACFGQSVRHATVGRPVRFVGAETAADEEFALTRLRAALSSAGFDEVQFALEPLAAAASYGSTLSRPQTVLIGDFGGGTSDFSLLNLTPGASAASEVLGNAGLPFAGDAFDARIVRHVIAPALGSHSVQRGGKSIPAVPAWIYANLERWHYLSFLRTRNVLEILTTAEKRAERPAEIEALRALVDEDLGYQLHRAVQRTKLALSVADRTEFIFAGTEAGTLELRTPVTRADFESWIAPELAQIEAAVEALLRDSGVDAGKVDHVFLTGGTSFVPSVRAIFERHFPNRISGGNEFTSVAQGLALRAASRSPTS